MKAILVDDEPDGIRTLQKMLALHCPQVTVVATCTSANAAKQQIHLLGPDLVFLDIQMPGKSGLELLTELSEKEFEVIFVTAHNEYMLQALQYSAADYLLKPVDEDRLVEAVQRVEKRIADGKKDEWRKALLHNLGATGNPAEMRLCLPTQKGFIVLKLDNIIYCEAERSYTVFHLEGGKSVMVSKPLLEYDQVLKDTSFLRIHKSFLINLHHVKEYQRGEGGTVIMSNNAEIEVSRRKKEHFLVKVKEVFRY
ncbi:MAG TPA: LytTR family DNA-binding domain-containing protein [Chitinophagaceae bacterium]|nr:LytTR family DNA-binding domain-containing protein [Chitinophagaceae bacterium]